MGEPHTGGSVRLVVATDCILGLLMLVGAWKAYSRDAMSLAWLFAATALVLFQSANRLAESQDIRDELTLMRQRLRKVESERSYRPGFPL